MENGNSGGHGASHAEWRMVILEELQQRHANSGSLQISEFQKGFVEVLAIYQSLENPNWFQGTMDAMRQYLWMFEEHNVLEFLFLARDYQFCLFSECLLRIFAMMFGFWVLAVKNSWFLLGPSILLGKILKDAVWGRG
ncbi:hypothetical protein V6N11_007860 [Hibiscus sabdariffa]|uniref:glucose-1-phosphate adenylyltransferase n=1 Tax=Hibiscus sabdariffa TaxID=183260 RepID=A0ABR2PZ41_9ROSI